MRLLVVTLCCFVASPIVRADPTEDAAIKVIKQLGGKVEQNGSWFPEVDKIRKTVTAIFSLTRCWYTGPTSRDSNLRASN
jgi:hypothetical protein